MLGSALRIEYEKQKKFSPYCKHFVVNQTNMNLYKSFYLFRIKGFSHLKNSKDKKSRGWFYPFSFLKLRRIHYIWFTIKVLHYWINPVSFSILRAVGEFTV